VGQWPKVTCVGNMWEHGQEQITHFIADISSGRCSWVKCFYFHPANCDRCVSDYTDEKHAHRRGWADSNNVDAVNEFISLCENPRSVIVPTQMMWWL
jgi:hypothetical protein